MIDKLFPRILSSDKDNRIRPKIDMNDALNVVATEDFNAVDEATDGGNSGVLKPSKGNEAQPIKTYEIDQIFTPQTPPINRRVIGRVSDPRSGVVYMFIYSEIPAEQGVYAYDAYGFFPGPNQAYRPIYRTSEFQFQSLGRVSADIVHITGPNDTYRTILYFTDDVNEPRKLDVSRCVDQNFITPTDASLDYAMNSVDDKDLITACPKGPLHPIQFSWQFDAGQRTSNFRRVPGMQFAFQCIYETGEESAISTYSDIAVPDEYLRQGYYINNLNLPDYLELVVPSNVDGVTNFTQEVERVRLLVRRGNIGAWYIIDEVDWSRFAGDPIIYEFYNDRVLTGLTNEEQNRDFEALPQVAQAIAVVENRLMYGNYVEGFDEVPLQASVDVNYYDRPQEFLNISINATPVVAPIAPYGETQFNTLDGDPAIYSERTVGVALDFGTLPDAIPANSVITCNLRFDFGGSIELYSGMGTHHASQIIADDRLASRAQTRDGSNAYYTTNEAVGDLWAMDIPVPVAGYYNGGVSSGLRWRTHAEVDDIVNSNNSPCALGTSGTSPLRFQGPQGTTEQLAFNVTLRTTAAITTNVTTVVRNAVLASLEYGDPADAQFEVLNISNQATYSYNLNLQDPTDDDDYNENLNSGSGSEDLLSLGALTLGTTDFNPLVRAKCRSEVPSFAIVPTHNNRHLDYARLISPVHAANSNQNTVGSDFTRSAAGWIIVNAATLSFRLRGQDLMADDPLGNGILTLEVSNVSNCDVRTCIPVVNTAGTQGGADYSAGENWLRFEGWRVFSGDYLYNNDIFAFGPAQRRDYSAAFSGLTEGTWQPANLGQRARYAGWLVTEGDQINPATIPGTNMYITNSMRRQVAVDAFNAAEGATEDEFFFLFDQIGTSFVDGQFTPAVYQGRYSDQIIDPNDNFSDQSGHLFSSASSQDIGCYGTMAVMWNYGLWGPATVGVTGTGTLVEPELGGRTVDGVAGFEVSADNFLTFNTWERIGGQLVADTEGPGNVLNSVFDDSPLWIMQGEGLNGPQPEVSLDAYIQQQEEAGNYRSFKTNATHALGIIYYDERGRPGNVNPIDPVYVSGYSPFERNGIGFQGRVDMTITLESDPPQWAHFYQLVYGGSLTVQKFIQYSAGGAYIATSGDAEQLNNIYVSLNYLQFHPTVSYSEAFGAVHPDGTSDLYVFSPGDYLRVISYFTDETTQIFPENYLFEIAGQVTLGGDATTNVLYEAQEGAESVDVPDHLQGQFLILKDNISATGFTFSAVASEANTGEPSTLNFWGNRCVFEIITPRREADLENLVYRETSQVYNVGRQGNNVYHQTPVVLFQNGDVWWRSVPVNIQEYNNGFVNLIQTVSDDDVEELEPFANTPRFRNVYLESATFTDTFPGADINGYGKAKIYRPDSAQVRRFASLIFGDDNNYSTRRVRFTVFNPSLAPFKDLPNEHGAINAILNYNDSLFVVQEDKASIVPVNRQIISDALGSNTLIATAKVLGEQQLIPGHAGADNNRESVIKVDDTVYFAHKGRHEVYRYVPRKGIEIISNAGLNAYFVSLFRDQGFGPATRVISGYDSLKDEYIITVIQASTLFEPSISEYTQPPVQLIGDPGAVTPGGDTTGGVIDPDFDPIADEIKEDIDAIINIGGVAPDGVAPTDGWPPPDGAGAGGTDNGIIDVAIENKDKIIEALGGGITGFPNPADANAYSIVGGTSFDNVSGLFTFDINVGAVLPAGVMTTLGDFSVTNGSFNSSTGIATFSVSPFVISAVPGQTAESYAGTELARAPAVAITENNYTTYLNDSGQLVGALSVIEALSVRRFYLVDRIKQVIAQVKNVNEQNIVDALGTTDALVKQIRQDLEDLGINNDPNFAVLLASMDTAYEEFESFMTDVVGLYTLQTITLQSGETISVQGFANFSETDYPLSAVEYNVLTQIGTLVDNLAVPINALANSNALDISTTLSALISENANLRSNVDVLADQVQALSDAPSNFGGSTFIPNVNSNQPESVTVSTLAGDGQLTFDDVLRSFDPILQFIIDNNATTTTIIEEVEVGTPLDNELAARLIIEFLAALAQEQGFTDRGDATSPSVQRQAYSLSTLKNLADESSAEQALLTFYDRLDPGNLNAQAGQTSTDLLASLIEFGQPSETLGFKNPYQPSSPFFFTGETQSIHAGQYLSAASPIDVLVAAGEQLGRDFLSDVQLQTTQADYPLFYIGARAVIKNLSSGRFVNPSLPGNFVTDFNPNPDFMTWADSSLEPVEFGWEDPRMTGTLAINSDLYTTFLTIGYDPFLAWTISYPGMQSIINTVKQFYIEAIQEGTSSFSFGFVSPSYANPGTTARVVEKIAEVRDGATTQYFNFLANPSPTSRFGNPVDFVEISEDQRNNALAQAINYVNNAS